MRKAPLLMLFMLRFVYYLPSFPELDQDRKPLLERPEVSAIEEKLVEHVNRERLRSSLSPLKSIPCLSSLAFRHSQDMAAHKKLTHFSTTGHSYLERLVDAGFYFIKIGENVAASETFRDDLVHQRLMSSPEHRENILDPDFDSIGIGIVCQENKYYITQDFLQSVNILEIDEAKKKIESGINGLRLKNSLPPLTFSEEASAIAHSFSAKRAKGQPLPNIGNMFGVTHIKFITFPSLDMTESSCRELKNNTYGKAGVGVWFGRLKEYPGGTYVITLFLFPHSVYKNMNAKDLVKFALDAFNIKRKEQDLPPLKLDNELARQASHISEQLKRQSSRPNILPSNRQEILSYVTEDLSVWPSELEKKILRKALKKIGLGISSKKNEKNQKRTFWVTLIL
jgi:uncharacterized protein YkwD